MSVALLGSAVGLLAALGGLESVRHARRLARIPVRVHVAGTRGKSSVTRLVAGALREGGRRTLAKTTGTLPRLVLPDGRELEVHRPRGANVIEQIDVVATASALDVDALVLECMALRPEFHWLCESKLVRATHAAITNARADHLDVMGPTEADVARCLAGMIPVKGVLVTSERTHRAILEEACRDRSTRLVAVEDAEIAEVTDAELRPFEHVEHRENVALALRLAAELGVPRATALEGMWRAPADPGALTEHALSFFGRRIVFVNAFAANDPDSTARIWRLARERHPGLRRVVPVWNLRQDRADRTRQLAAASFWREADEAVLLGSGAEQFAREAVASGVTPERLHLVEDQPLEAVFERIVERCGGAALVVGMGNVGERGLDLVRMFRNRSAPTTPDDAGGTAA